jgi:hypothetical protein
MNHPVTPETSNAELRLAVMELQEQVFGRQAERPEPAPAPEWANRPLPAEKKWRLHTTSSAVAVDPDGWSHLVRDLTDEQRLQLERDTGATIHETEKEPTN